MDQVKSETYCAMTDMTDTFCRCCATGQWRQESIKLAYQDR